MGQLIIKREKAMVGFAVQMNCYVNDQPICKLKNGEEATCDVSDGIIEFKCNLTGNPTSDVICLDMTGRDYLQVTVKQGSWKPQVTVFDKGAIVVVEEPTKKIAVPRAPFSASKSVGGYFGINEHSRQWAVGKGLIPSLKNATPYSYDDIVDFELIEDGTSISKGGLGRAAVGGLLFGGVGAIVGGVTGGKKAKQKCTSLMVKITVNNLSAPTEYIKLITTPTDKSSFTYKAAFQSAQEIVSLLQLICNQRDNEKIVEQATTSAQELSTADEIRKFKSLLDEGIITEEEFLAKKRQLLGL